MHSVRTEHFGGRWSVIYLVMIATSLFIAFILQYITKVDLLQLANR